MGHIFNPDFQDFILALNKAHVRYILVGGYAVILHGYNRTTGDMDIWVERSEANYLKLLEAFHLFGMSTFDMSLQNFLDPSAYDVFTFGVPPVSIDIMLDVKGLSFPEVYSRSTSHEVDDIQIRLIDRASLIEAKHAAGRFRDMDDIEHLL